MIVGCSQILEFYKFFRDIPFLQMVMSFACMVTQPTHIGMQVLQAPFKGAALTSMEIEWNKAMNEE